MCDALVPSGAQVTFDAAEDIQWVAREYLPVLERIAAYLPNMDFVVNTLDTPRVRHGAGPFLRSLMVICFINCRWLVMC